MCQTLFKLYLLPDTAASPVVHRVVGTSYNRNTAWTEEIGNVSKPSYIECMPACQVQENANQMSFAFYPQMHNFF